MSIPNQFIIIWLLLTNYTENEEKRGAEKACRLPGRLFGTGNRIRVDNIYR